MILLKFFGELLAWMAAAYIVIVAILGLWFWLLLRFFGWGR
ncbi:MAG TPA: hypothetical protein VFA39_15735 [Steroidobacteraceae bacterium]|nr:hypothetical protein [Steroidobacteraceae bacterium]